MTVAGDHEIAGSATTRAVRQGNYTVYFDVTFTAVHRARHLAGR